MFLKNFKLKFEYDSGFTTIELMAVIVILSIISIAVSSVYSSGFNFFVSTRDKADIQREIRFIADYITENVKFADAVELVASMSASLESDEKIIGLEGTTVQYKEYGGTTRTIAANTAISDMIFNIDGEYLTVAISSADYQLNTKIILNNCNPDKLASESHAIRFK